MRYELADWEWSIIRPMLPDNRSVSLAWMMTKVRYPGYICAFCPFFLFQGHVENFLGPGRYGIDPVICGVGVLMIPFRVDSPHACCRGALRRTSRHSENSSDELPLLKNLSLF